MRLSYDTSFILFVSFLELSWTCLADASTKYGTVKKTTGTTSLTSGILPTTPASPSSLARVIPVRHTVSSLAGCAKGKSCDRVASSTDVRGASFHQVQTPTGSSTLSWNTSDLGSANNTKDNLDACAMWEKCSIHKHPRVIAWLQALPGCPCLKPRHIYTNDHIYDPVHKKSFHWQPMNHLFEKMHIYKPYAKFCIRQVVTRRSTAVQQCCYDKYHRLITRGSGAGTPQLVSRDVDMSIHDALDLLPWRLCQGDWTRYHKVRPPNNALNCTQNPDDWQYTLQRKKATEY